MPGACSTRRHFFWLQDGDFEHLLRNFQRALRDPRLEIRGHASNSLAGLVKVLPERVAAQLRADILRNAEALFPPRRRRARGGAGAANGANGAAAGLGVGASNEAAERHACVLGLRALLQSSPHRIPAWCALLALNDRHFLSAMRAMGNTRIRSDVAQINWPFFLRQDAEHVRVRRCFMLSLQHCRMRMEKSPLLLLLAPPGRAARLAPHFGPTLIAGPF